MPTSPSSSDASPTIVLSSGAEPPRYPALRFAAKAFRVLAILELVGGLVWMWPATQIGPIPGILAGFIVAVSALLLWVGAELCELGIEVVDHLRHTSR